ncbi:MAG: DUF21 domain-containing protein [Planctomycetota bacterium]|nr:MAG: DUF21 domain-containing protein [Planctomycetota bacterium]REJ88573.1 MAG: DUF21 domain-containing protein [Planctomycetota bacterium]REK17545.1 MAG: DUF21 domain-containing protein [Planctomycetota bacterium]REK47454.1 MAG: DUF21 domain-containing protein [Planctomycetota bacterium]
MTILITSVAVVLVVSGLCSLCEAAIYAVRKPYVRTLVESGSLSGNLLSRFKENIEQPISAILILNTAANTAGAAVAGAQARSLLGDGAVVWFSAVFTVAVLFCSEIIPKIVGVVYNQTVSRVLALPLGGLIALLYPMIWVIQKLSQRLQPAEPPPSAPEEEIHHFAIMGAEEGSILPDEAELVKNVLKLDDIDARDIMTPRTVVDKVPAEMTVREVAAQRDEWTYSRIPVFAKNDPDNWIGVVFSRDILNCLGKDEFDVTMESLCTPIDFVPAQTKGHILLKEFIKRRRHLFGVLNEYGGTEGVVTLEDVMESLIGDEIVDEVDTAVDLQEVARSRHLERQRDASDSTQDERDDESQ